MTSAPTLEEFRAAIAAERRKGREAGIAFENACRSGDIDAMHFAVDQMNETLNGWRYGLKRAAQIARVSDKIRDAFLSVWIESKSLPLHVGDRRAVSNAARVLLPRSTHVGPLRVYRGAHAGERRRRLYGFSWTTRIDVARTFAENSRLLPDGGIVLETLAPGDAVLLIRKDEGYYDEAEVIVDPFQLDRVFVAEKLNSTLPPDWKARADEMAKRIAGQPT